MLTFSQFNLLKPKFIGLHLSDESSEKMMLWCNENEFDTTKDYERKYTDNFEFHITVFYTSNSVPCRDIDTYFEPIKVEFEKMELFGLNKDVPVLKVKMPNQELIAVRKFYESQGCADQWEMWRPHMTVSYNLLETSKVGNVPNFPVYIDRLVVKDQK